MTFPHYHTFILGIEEDKRPLIDNLKIQKPKFIPLYRKAYGGIIIYDIDADIPDQPIPEESVIPITKPQRIRKEIDLTFDGKQNIDNSMLNAHYNLGTEKRNSKVHNVTEISKEKSIDPKSSNISCSFSR